jgi:hypothetical protein
MHTTCVHAQDSLVGPLHSGCAFGYSAPATSAATTTYAAEAAAGSLRKMPDNGFCLQQPCRWRSH